MKDFIVDECECDHCGHDHECGDFGGGGNGSGVQVLRESLILEERGMRMTRRELERRRHELSCEGLREAHIGIRNIERSLYELEQGIDEIERGFRRRRRCY